MQPPALKNDCFALPPGVDWTPVDTALDLLKSRLSSVVGSQQIDLSDGLGRILAQPIFAARANPPTANSAVDGFGFAHASVIATDDADVQELPLIQGRAAAGQPYDGQVPAGHAIRILTGARIPLGVDTVILEEDTTSRQDRIAFRGGLKKGANTRKAGEDVAKDAPLFDADHRLMPQDLALLAATGIAKIPVHTRLKVGVLSTGDELIATGQPPGETGVYDANRPMLLALLDRWGYQPVDLGHARDDRDLLRAHLDQAVTEVDAILTSGGASAGDEDHLSALMQAEGQLHSWRIAIKPGRPLALGQWQGVPLFGLPGNPVAAFVCTLIFARPALGLLAGATWQTPTGFLVPAGFSKSKKPGRREYLRAKIGHDGRVACFKSEGSGRISGLSWAEGLVELGDAARDINEGNPVTYYPYSAFGI